MDATSEAVGRPVVFTDLDGTLIDFESYATEVAEPAVKQLIGNDIPVIFCSSKTRREQAAIQSEFGIATPCIVENGSGIYVPQGVSYPHQRGQMSSLEQDCLIELGVSANSIREAIKEIESSMGLDLAAYSDLSIDAIVAVTGLDHAAAERAQNRDFSETLTAKLNTSVWQEINSRLGAYNLQCLCGGRFYTVSDRRCNKGKALQQTLSAFQSTSAEPWRSIAIGDSANDVDMLAAADQAYLVQQPSGAWFEVDLPHLSRIEGIGPRGWVKIAESLLA